MQLQTALLGVPEKFSDFKRWLHGIVDEDIHSLARNNKSDVIPAIGKDRSAPLVLRIDIPEHKSVDYRAVLDAVVFGAAVRKTTNVEFFRVLSVTLPKAYAGNVFSERLHIELNRSIMKGQIVESDIAR